MSGIVLSPRPSTVAAVRHERLWRVLLMAALVACRVPSPILVAGTDTLRLVAAPGARINAQLKPALELANGTVLRFDSPHLTPDSSYFAAAPELVPPAGAPHRGTLRASVCPRGERVCRTLTMAVSW